jgi:hypothetical protein
VTAARLTLIILSFCIILAVTIQPSIADTEKLSRSVHRYLSTSDQTPAKIWIYFTDHGESGSAELRDWLSHLHLSERVLERRSLRSHAIRPDVHDLSVNADYVDAVRAIGCEVRHESRYFNAVSAWATPRQIRAIVKMPFVGRVDKVRTGTRKARPLLPKAIEELQRSSAGTGDIDYGLSGAQHDMINTKPLHTEGYTGKGVRVAVLDTGFFRDHPGLAHLNVIDEWDFVDNDGVTADQPGDPEGGMFHGTWSIGILAAYWPGFTMGVAWDAEYILAKTERVEVEIQSEEDDYIAALEWADGLGADIVNSSLGYFYWYDQEDMDGDTALITRAVDIAASRGILVVTASGNENTTSWGTIIAPADADSAVAVGAVDVSGGILNYSSRGPTADGRIKPDVVAQGRLVATLHWQSPPTVTGGSGTSAATPLVAGAATLVLQKNPDWSPIEVRDALRATASQAETPNNTYGWGIIDAYAAANHSGRISVAVDIRPGSCDSPFNPRSQGVLPALLHGSNELDVRSVDVATLRLAGTPALRAKVVDMAGDGECSQSPDGQADLLLKFDSSEIARSMVLDKTGKTARLVLTGGLNDGTAIEGEATVRIVGNQGGPARSETTRAVLSTGVREPFPNPFNPTTRITYDLAQSTRVELLVYNVRGELVATLVDGHRPPGTHTIVWDASGQASGAYFLRLNVNGFEQTRKVLLVK